MPTNIQCSEQPTHLVVNVDDDKRLRRRGLHDVVDLVTSDFYQVTKHHSVQKNIEEKNVGLHINVVESA